MKSKITFLFIAVATILSFASCSVTYRTRHPRPVHEVIVVPVRVGFQSPSIAAPILQLPSQRPVNEGLTIIK